MKTIKILTIIFLFWAVSIQAQDTTKVPEPPVKHGPNFVDEDGDGYNDNAPDHDGDGIPNGLDPDYTAGKKNRAKNQFIDLDGDGINDNAVKNRNQRNRGMGPAKTIQPESQSTKKKQQKGKRN